MSSGMPLRNVSAAPPAALGRGAGGPWLALIVAMMFVALLHRESFGELVAVWYRSVSYTHCFFVLPVAGALIWRDRARLDGVTLQPWLPGLAVLAMLGVLWLAGRVTTVNSLRDFAVVATVPVLAVTILGRGFGRAMVFPLAFVMFSWPFGELLIPIFIDRTADFTVWALRVTGVPVFREGNTFVIPSGQWSVVEECSGIRYLMASASAGCVFGHLYMRSVRRRWAFFGIAVLVPIVANWLRAYLIVLLGHLSGNKLATGVDHLIYGWVFFGAVMIGVFMIGARWADRDLAGPPMGSGFRAVAPTRTWAVAVVAAILVGAAPLWMDVLDAKNLDAGAGELAVVLPPAQGDWQSVPGEANGWIPKHPAAVAFGTGDYIAAGRRVSLAVALSRESGNGEKLLTFAGTSLVDYGIAEARTLARDVVDVPALGSGARVIERRMRFQGRPMLSWEWYRVDGLRTDSIGRAKLEQAWQRVRGHRSVVGRWTLHAFYDTDVASARDTLTRFVDSHRDPLDRPLPDAGATK